MADTKKKESRWADLVDDEDEWGGGNAARNDAGVLAGDTQTMPDGSKVVTEYVFKEGGQFKVTKTFRTTTKRHKVFAAAVERRKRWVKFGKARDNTAELTSVGEPVLLELGKAEELQEKKTDREIEKMIDQANRQARLAGGQGGSADGLFVASNRIAQEGEEPGKSNLFRAAGTRGETVDGRPQRDDSCTVRVTNLSEDISEDDLRALFGRFGRIMRCYVGKDRVTQERKGFAFITFQEKGAAGSAIDKLHRHPLNHVILNVAWAQPPGEKK